MELWEAAYGGELSKVKELIDGGADIKEKGGFLLGTPLHHATRGGYIDIVDYLIKNEADVHCKDQHDSSPLHLASLRGHLEVVKLLLIKGSDITSRDHQGSTALHVACSGGHTAVVVYLLQHGADMESRDKDGYSPFHLACLANEFHVVQYLTSKGCAITATTEDGRSGLQIAKRWGENDRVAKYLRTKLQERQAHSDVRKRPHFEGECSSQEKKKVRLNESAGEGSQPSTSSKVVESSSSDVPDDLQPPEIVRISRRVASKWVDVALLTDQFELHEINNIRSSRIDEDGSSKARAMLELYITRNGSRRRLGNAIREIFGEDLAQNVLSGHFIDAN